MLRERAFGPFLACGRAGGEGNSGGGLSGFFLLSFFHLSVC